MQHAASAYSKVAQTTQSARELEAAILMKAALRLQSVRDNWDEKRSELQEALAYNRKLWIILVTSATEADNPLPHLIKQNIANLGLFVFNRTIAVTDAPDPAKLSALVNINRELAAGLRGMAPPSTAAA